ncbi:mitochondrial carrier [Tilletiaria anomala UBC 951]|uniref:Mitochondrial carrier n=1 Tax=Tilletiaria anomala (strain ATCC 24038 / CBS 436.72 / UBC 951) TaxID=1037660 RepID=A0A066VU07_TILAU|nr:mitochondrial carrier [Tilletiaria anomala UBC 951]KDN44951.1 mitochondrial carrier [Tilletiaria anomala UBC 951]
MASSTDRPYSKAGPGDGHPFRPYYTPREDAFVVSAPRFSTTNVSSSGSSTGSKAGSSASASGVSSAVSGTRGSTGKSHLGAGPPAAAHNRYFDGSSDEDLLAAAAAGSGSGASPPSGGGLQDRRSLTQIGKALLVAGGLQYASTLLAMPFEVGKLLLQIQWAPREDVWVKHTIRAGARAQQQGVLASNRKARSAKASVTDENGTQVWGDEGRMKRRRLSEAGMVAPRETDMNNVDEPEDMYEGGSPTELLPEAEGDWGELEGKDFGGEDDELSDEEDAEKYFNDLSSRPQRSFASSSHQGVSGTRRKATDQTGYVMRKNMFDEGTRPEFVMPVVFTGGVWEMIKAVARGREGWLGLWKGSFTTFVLDLVAGTVQPMLSSFLSVFVPGSKSLLPLPYTPKPWRTLSVIFASHLITGVLVSPLDLVRTRLIAQSTLPRHRKYRGPYDALVQVLEEEGGWKTTYLHPHLLVPTILDYTFRPFISLATPLFIDHYLRVDPNSSPVLYALWELIVSTIGLGLTLPIETVRRRLQVQARAEWGKKPQTKFGSSLVVKLGADGTEMPTTQSAASRTHSGGQGGVDAQQSNSSIGSHSGSGSRIGIKGLRTCVETRPEAYAGVIDALYRIVTEETTISPKAKVKARPGLSGSADDSAGVHTREGSTASGAGGDGALEMGLARSQILAPSGHSSLGGLGGLYRGFSMGFGANLLVFLLTVVSGERNTGTGWAEI